MNRVRAEKRLLCADIVEIRWHNRFGRERLSTALLEDISPGGACLQMEEKLAPGVTVDLRHGNAHLSGAVKYCVYREFGYFVGVQFTPDSKWSRRSFRPKHLLDFYGLPPHSRP